MQLISNSDFQSDTTKSAHFVMKAVGNNTAKILCIWVNDAYKVDGMIFSSTGSTLASVTNLGPKGWQKDNIAACGLSNERLVIAFIEHSGSYNMRLFLQIYSTTLTAIGGNITVVEQKYGIANVQVVPISGGTGFMIAWIEYISLNSLYSRTYIPCTLHSDCSVTTGRCLSNGFCGTCSSNSDCDTGKYCQLSHGACVECISNSNCADPVKSICETGSGKCVSCLTNSNCNSSYPICNTDNNNCVQCTSDSHCVNSPKTVCNQTTNMCGECFTTTQCLSNPLKKVCNLANLTSKCSNSQCVECSSDSNCTAPYSVCNPSTRKCQMCLLDSDCASLGGPPKCNLTNGTCVNCLSDSQCTDPLFPRCEISSGTCTGCTSNSYCTSNLPLCRIGSKTCVECLTNSDWTNPAKPTCNQTTFRCGECFCNANCLTAQKPLCDLSSLLCVACLGNSDCPGAFSQANKFCYNNTCLECGKNSDCSTVSHPDQLTPPSA